MKKLALYIFLISLATFDLLAQTSVWEVKGKGTTLYLGGTIHLLRESDYPLPEAFEKVYKNAATLVFETDIAKLDDPSMQTKIMGKALYTDGRTLQSVLSDSTYNALAAVCNDYGLPIAMMQKVKPSLVVLTLSALKMQQMGLASKGVDKHFYGLGYEDQKEIAWLESIDDQIDILTRLGEGNEEEFVKYSLENNDEMDENLEAMVNSWRTGSPDTMEDEIDEMGSEFPDVYDAMLKDRNNKWVPQIIEMLEDKDVEFVLVGTLHMYGEDGLIQQLKDKGFKIKQL